MTVTTDLLLVRPGDRRTIYGDLSFDLAAVEPPLWAALLAAYIREAGFTVKILDLEVENISKTAAVRRMAEMNPALVGVVITGSNLSASTWKMTAAGELSRRLKAIAPHMPQLFWGLHPSALPEQTLQEEACDFVCRGEGFTTLTQLLESLCNNRPGDLETIAGLCFQQQDQVIINDDAPVLPDLDLLPMPAWDLLPMGQYRAHNWHCFDQIDQRQPYGVIYTSFGCPFRCAFCALRTLFGGPGIRYRGPLQVLAEIDHLVQRYQIRNIKILDECFTIQRSHTEQICDGIMARGYDLNLWAYARIDTVDAPLLKKMRKAGVTWLCYGIESGSHRILKQISKGRYDKADIVDTIHATRSAGINILGNFMFGLPEDDHATLRETLDFAKQLQCEYTNFYTTMAYPGSQLYQQALRDQIDLPKSWLGYSQFSRETLPLPTKHLSAAEVLRFRDDAFLEFHQDAAYLSMIQQRFGPAVAQHIEAATRYRLPRNHI